MRRGAATALLSLVLGAVVGVAAPTGTAVAASTGSPVDGPCPAGHGVTAVVDPGSLGGAPVARCDAAGGGRTALEIFERLGWPLTQVRTAPDFVCQVAGRPAGDPCVNVPPAAAYWSLWQSDGSTDWIYASLGAPSVRVQDGGWVGFLWDDVAGDPTPAISPAGRAPSSTGSSAVGSSSATPGSATARTHARTSSGGGLPGWAPPLAVVVVIAAAGGAAYRRRKA